MSIINNHCCDYHFNGAPSHVPCAWACCDYHRAGAWYGFDCAKLVAGNWISLRGTIVVAPASPPVPVVPPEARMSGFDAWMPSKTSNSNRKLPPQICKVCNFKNDYAGVEHLQPNGSYICRSCPKPRSRPLSEATADGQNDFPDLSDYMKGRR